MSNYRKIPTSAEVYAVIYARHRDELTPYGSFSDPTGTAFGGDGTVGRMETSYALKGSDFPLMEIRTTWDIVNGTPHNTMHEYWLCIPLKDEE